MTGTRSTGHASTGHKTRQHLETWRKGSGKASARGISQSRWRHSRTNVMILSIRALQDAIDTSTLLRHRCSRPIVVLVRRPAVRCSCTIRATPSTPNTARCEGGKYLHWGCTDRPFYGIFSPYDPTPLTLTTSSPSYNP